MGLIETVGTAAGSGGVITIVGAWLFGRRKAKTDMLKTEIDALQQVVTIWKSLAMDMKVEVDELKVEVGILREENKLLSKEVHRLTILISGK